MPARKSIASLLALAAVVSLGAGPALAGPPAAIPDGDARTQRALRSFEKFADGWMRKMARAEDHGRRRALRGSKGIRYRGFGSAFDMELRPTGLPTAPYVGILRYPEHTVACSDAAGRKCRKTEARTITEVFRFQNGRWVY